MRRLLAPLLLALALSACIPVVERRDGDSDLYFVEAGVTFDAGSQTARGVIIIVIADELALPTDTPCAVVEADTAECRLGDLEGVWLVEFDGDNPDASVSFRRPNLNTLYHLVARRR